MYVNEKYKLYTNGEKTIRVYDDDIPPEGYWRKKSGNSGLTKEDPRVNSYVTKSVKTRKETDSYIPGNKGLTKDTDERVLKNSDAAKQGMLNKYGVENPSQLPGYKPGNTGLTKETSDGVKKISDKAKGRAPGNKGLTKETDSRVAAYGQNISIKKQEWVKNILKDDPEYFIKGRQELNTKLATNKTFNTSSNEEKMYEELCDEYGIENVVRQYSDSRYPFACDFYIESEDLFIELNLHWTHGGMPFDPDNPECIKKLENGRSKNTKYYNNAIYTGTDLDVRKQKYANENNLNILFIY